MTPFSLKARLFLLTFTLSCVIFFLRLRCDVTQNINPSDDFFKSNYLSLKGLTTYMNAWHDHIMIF